MCTSGGSWSWDGVVVDELGVWILVASCAVLSCAQEAGSNEYARSELAAALRVAVLEELDQDISILLSAHLLQFS